MSLQVAGSATTENSTLDVIDVTKVALSPTCLDITGKYLVKEIVEEGESEEDAETQVVEIAQTGCEKILIDMKDPLIQEEILLDGKLQVAKGSRVSMSAEATADAVKVTVVNSKDAPEEPVEIATLKVDLKLDAETGDLLVESEEFDSADKMIKARSLRMTKVKE
jgi:hypothetical protein